MTADLRREAVAIYIAHHGDDARAREFADQVIDRSEVYDLAQMVMRSRLTRDQRRRRRADLEAIGDTARKLGGLLARIGPDMICWHDMRDGRRIGYPDILDFMRQQAAAELELLTANPDTGSKRHDIDALVAHLGVVFDYFDVPRERMMPLLNLVIDDADDKTLANYLAEHRK